MKYIKLFEEYIEGSLWRNTNYKWLLELLKKGKLKSKPGKFISFSNEDDSGGQDDFGGTRIEFHSDELYSQGAINIEYDSDFFNNNPEISLYVTAYKGEEDYYDSQDFDDAESAWEEGELDWDTYVEDYAEEAEIIIKQLKFNNNLIKSVKFIKDKPNKELLNLLQKNNINYEL